MRKLLLFMIVLTGCVILAGPQELGSVAPHQRALGQGSARDAMLRIRNYFHQRALRSSLAPDHCQADSTLLLHTSMWQIDPGTIVHLDCNRAR